MRKHLISALIFLTLLTNCSEDEPTEKNNSNIRKNLVGEYLFNSNADDTSPENVNHGLVFGASLTTDRSGNAGQAYAFDGVDDYISIPDNDASDLVGDYTISLWIDANAIQTDVSSTNNFILRKWDGDLEHPYPFGFSLLNQTHPDNPNEFFIETYDGSCGNGKSAYSGVITYDGFKHYVLVKTGNKLIQYLNGVKISEVSHTLTCAPLNTVPITIGTSVHLIRFFKGKIDDLRFYNIALDQSRVTELYEEEPSN